MSETPIFPEVPIGEAEFAAWLKENFPQHAQMDPAENPLVQDDRIRFMLNDIYDTASRSFDPTPEFLLPDTSIDQDPSIVRLTKEYESRIIPDNSQILGNRYKPEHRFHAIVANKFHASLIDAPQSQWSELSLYKGSDFVAANLAKASISESGITGGKFHYANLSGSKQVNNIYRECDFSYTNLCDAVCERNRFQDCYFESTDAKGASFIGMDDSVPMQFSGSVFRDHSDFSNATFRHCDLSQAKFSRTEPIILTGATIEKSYISENDIPFFEEQGAILSDCIITEKHKSYSTLPPNQVQGGASNVVSFRPKDPDTPDRS